MTNVFISYSKRRDLTFRLRDYLKSKGLTVWVDQDSLEARGEFDGQIRAALQQAEAIVTLWTEEAIASKWVIAEATYAADGPDGPKLINVVPNGVSRGQLPERFQKYHLLVETDLRPLDIERIFDQVIKIREGVPLPAEVPLREHFEAKYDELLLDTKRLPLPTDAAEAPSVLLQAKYGVVPFIDLQGLKPALINWALGEGEGARFKPAAGRLIHGPGGLGKTRLMIEVASALREKGWSAGFLNRLEMRADDPEPELRQKPKLREEALQQLITNGEDSGVAIVIDYAEGRTEDVRTLAAQIRKASRERPDRPLVLFLLVREIGEWWNDLRQSEPTVAAVFAAGLGQLSEVGIAQNLSREKRNALFDVARDKFAQAAEHSSFIKPNREIPAANVLARLDNNDDYDRPLAVLMEALLYVYSKTIAVHEVGTAALLDGILDLEVLHWRKIVEADEAQLRARGERSGRPRFGEHCRALLRATCLVTLVGGTSSALETRQLLAKGEASIASPETLRDLGAFYGNGRGGHSGLEPDLLGEHLVARAADVELIDVCLDCIAIETDPWKRSARRKVALTVLQRATQPIHGTAVSAKSVALIDHIIVTHLEELATPILQVIDKEQGALQDRLYQAVPKLTSASLEKLSSTLPTEHLEWRNLLLLVAKSRVENLKSERDNKELGTIDHQLKIGNAQNNYAIQLQFSGEINAALEQWEDAANIFRTLSVSGTRMAKVALSTVLGNVGAMYARFKFYDDALAAYQEAQCLLLALLNCDGRKNCVEAPGDPNEQCWGQLAEILNGKATALSGLNRPEEALSTAKVCALLYEGLARANPIDYMARLSSARHNLALRLWDAGHLDLCVDSLRDAILVRRAFAQASKGLGLFDLVLSLAALSRCLRALGKNLEAFNVAAEGLELAADYSVEMRNMIIELRRDYVAGAHATDAEPDVRLLERVSRALGEPIA